MSRPSLSTIVIPIQFASATEWGPMSTSRLQRERAANRRMGPREQEIESRLTTPVEVRFDNRPTERSDRHAEQDDGRTNAYRRPCTFGAEYVTRSSGQY